VPCPYAGEVHGELAQLIALAAHGSAWLAGRTGALPPDLEGTNSTFRFVRQVRFELEGSLLRKPVVATDVASWLEEKDPPGSWAAEYRPSLVHDDRAVAVGSSRYLAADGSVESEYYNVFFLTFDDEGRCREFTEVYMKRPDATSAA